MRYIPILLCFVAFSFLSQAQAPVNDNCSGAINIPIGNPPACGSGVQQSTVSTVTGNITNATPGNPYIFQPNCSGAGGPNQAVAANDVWYSFVATGYQASITINSSFANPNIAFYSGNCAALGGGIGGCAVGAGGNVSLVVNQMVPGTTYYLQVSGNVGQVGTFTLGIRNSVDCQDCLQTTTLTVNPPPVNGAYAPNTTVNFCLHIGNYKTINTNWLHGVQLTFGTGWNPASVVPNVPLPISAAGTWSYYPAGIGIQNAVNWGPGWYFDFAPQDGNPRNNFGDSNSGGIAGFVDTSTPAQWNFCVSLTTNPACTPGSNLNVTFNTSGDGESGSWNNAGCSTDAAVVFNAVGSCCPPVMTSTPVTCFGTSTGSAVATPVGVSGPYNYTWNGPAGYTSSANGVAGASAINNLAAGIYTVTVVNANLCAVSATVQVTQPTSVTAVTSSTNAGCTANGTASVTAAGGTGPYTYTWTPAGGNASSASVPQGSYTVTVQDSRLCTRIATVNVGFTGTISAAFTTPTPTQCLNGNSFTFNAVNPAGTHSYSFNPIAGSPAVGGTAVYGPVSFASAGTYSVTHTITDGLCTANATSVIVVNPMPVAIAGNNGPVCPGSNIALTSGGGTSYAWSGPNAFVSVAQNPNIAGAGAAQAGLYSVTVTALGCSSTATTNVVISTPTVTASNTGSYCAGSTIQLNSTAASSYTWTGPSAFSSNAQNPTLANATTLMAGNYNLIVSVGSCTVASSTSVIVAPLPTPVIVHNAPVCVGQALTLNGSGGVFYQWNGPAAFSNAAQNVTINPVALANSGVYSLTVTDANMCSRTGTSNIVINPLPVAVANSNGTVCPGTNILLTSGGGALYSWSGPNGFASAIQNPTINPAVVAYAGVYTVTVTALGCSSTATANLAVNIPTTSASNTGPYCAGSNVQLNTPAGGAYVWSGPNGFVSVNQNPSILLASAAAGGAYTVVATIGGCTAVATTTVTMFALPSPTISSNGPVCLGRDIILNAQGGTSYQWAGPSLFSSAIQSPTITSAGIPNSGVYTVTVTDANTCTNTISLNVQVNPLPIPSAMGATVCAGANAGLSASGGFSYSWTGPNGFASLLQNPVIVSTNTTHIGQYTVVVTNANTCTNTTVADVFVNDIPTPTITGNGGVCLNSVLSFTAQGGNTYQWSGPGSFLSLAPTITINAVSASQGGVYSVTVTSVNGCKASTSANATVYPLPPVNITSDIRSGCVPVCINYTTTSTLAIQTFGWDLDNGAAFGGNGSTAYGCYLSAGIHTVIASLTSTNGCRNSGTYTIEAYPRPVAEYIYQPTKPIVNINSNIQFTDVSNGANIVSWRWDFTNVGLHISTQQHPNFNYTEAGDYYAALVVTSDHGCKDTVMKKITVGEDFGIWIPNTFTPDGSGVNDTFQPKGYGIVNYEISIYDRWGENLYKGNDFGRGWDGYYKDQLCKTDVYVYRIMITNVYGKSLEYVGHVNLIR
jgi:gliding motility-associated-like protein